MENKEWQNTVTPEKRSQFVHNLIQAVSTLHITGITEQEIQNQASYLENQLYENSKSRADYYYNIAQQIYKIQENSNGAENEFISYTNSEELKTLFSGMNLSETTFDEEK